MVTKKLAVYLLLIGLAVLAAGLFGVAHNQISYTVSPEYFTKFKFWQFHLNDSPLPERIRASLVGFLAAWWMGIPLGLLIGAAGFMHHGHRRMLRVLLWSLAIATTFTLHLAWEACSMGSNRLNILMLRSMPTGTFQKM